MTSDSFSPMPLPAKCCIGSRVIGTIGSVAQHYGDAGLFGPFPKMIDKIRNTDDFDTMLKTPVWKAKFRKGSRLAGAASYSPAPAIQLNTRLFSEATTQDVLDTFRHEAAHILANLYYNASCGHDARWVRMARLIGDSGDQHHTMQILSRKAQAPYVYGCVNCPQVYHRYQLLRENHVYSCHRCNSKVEMQLQGFNPFTL